MHYAATISVMGTEEVVVVLPLQIVPAFDPNEPPPNAYLVDDEVQKGWIKQANGRFTPPPEPLEPTELNNETDQQSGAPEPYSAMMHPD